ncbi:replication regulatory protein RepA [Rahnella sp. ChDrAdgB13]|uniref:replication regulatory protein RepA n=1 Tax=Rahnella sp. ChDrAdgB13 TaxID=1850581 RepID=UPI001AD88E33|nr:replication regulatory protein RepA [Rahnella sp. ChDrAdgB13]
MSQVVNSDNVSERTKRPYRKGNPLSGAEKQRDAIARKRMTHKELKVFIEPKTKDLLLDICAKNGLTQSELLSKLIEQEARK